MRMCMRMYVCSTTIMIMTTMAHACEGAYIEDVDMRVCEKGDRLKGWGYEGI